MTGALAKLAKVPEIVAFTPCDENGEVADAVLAAMSLCGITEAYRVGGVAAIGAMAYGTESVPAVSKILDLEMRLRSRRKDRFSERLE